MVGRRTKDLFRNRAGESHVSPAAPLPGPRPPRVAFWLAVVFAPAVCSLAAISSEAHRIGVARHRAPEVNVLDALDDPDELYRRREDLASAKRAADLWAPRATTDFESAWKLARACYWLGTHGEQDERRRALDRGMKAGESAARFAPNRPEGHFWFAANMGALAESFGVGQGLKYRGRIKEELERALDIEPGWQDGSADAALGQWYFKVPRLFGGSRSKAEEHLRRALTYNPDSHQALSELADVVAAGGRRDEAIALLRRLIDAPDDPDWIPEDNDLKRKAAERLKTLGR